MTQHEDRDKVLAAFGGKKGLIDSGIPAVIFLVVFNVTDRLNSALFASIAVSAILTIIRLARRDTIQHALSGFIGVLICAWFANRTGNASDLYIPKLLTNLGYGTLYLVGNLVGWPVVVFAFGLFLTIALMVKKVKGAILIGIIVATIAAVIVETTLKIGPLFNGATGEVNPKGWNLNVPAMPDAIARGHHLQYDERCRRLLGC